MNARRVKFQTEICNGITNDRINDWITFQQSVILGAQNSNCLIDFKTGAQSVKPIQLFDISGLLTLHRANVKTMKVHLHDANTQRWKPFLMATIGQRL